MPDIILVEGPPEADNLVSLASDPDMVPPVALLVYASDAPSRSSFYPFAIFSPEWVALQFANRHNVPLRFMDLPTANMLALEDDSNQSDHLEPTTPDPLRMLAEAAGYTDSERWWENLVEHRQDRFGVFEAILQAITLLRSEVIDTVSFEDKCREASMRQTIRKARREGFKRIAVVCGAWHGPALANLPSAKADMEILTGLPHVKVAATWVPWTNSRLSFRSGYGAGIESPGWYAHIWNSQEDTNVRWMSHVSRLLREQDLAASPAQVVDCVRLADTLAALRNFSAPGLREMNDASQTVFSFGSTLQLKLIEDKLIVGEALGRVPESAPSLPLQKEIERTQRQLRLAPAPTPKVLDLDLRKETDLARSHFLHRLVLLNIGWGVPQKVQRAKGTFHEIWQIQWRPEFAVAIIEASLWGSTVLQASAQIIRRYADGCESLNGLCSLLDKTILADLPDSVTFLVAKLEDQSALAGDILDLMDSVSPLANVARYGTVRNTDRALIESIVVSLVTRISIRLPNACIALDDDAAREMYDRLRSVHGALSLLLNQELTNLWLNALTQIIDTPLVHGVVAGRAARILLDVRRMSQHEAAVLIKLTLTLATSPTSVADWFEGFLLESGQLLLLDDTIRHLVDEWVCQLDDDSFTTLLPLLRRTFSSFTSPERKQLGERIKLDEAQPIDFGLREEDNFDYDRANAALPLLLQLLGANTKQNSKDEQDPK